MDENPVIRWDPGQAGIRMARPATGRAWMSRTIDRAIGTLNSIRTGELSRILARLGEVQGALEELGEPALLGVLEEARQALSEGDLPIFRKRLQHVVSRLGHLR